jgi:hypothetical protein
MSGKFDFYEATVLQKHAHLNFFTQNNNANQVQMVLSFVDYRLCFRAVPRITEIPKFYRNHPIFTELTLDITEITIKSSEIPSRRKDITLF